MKKSVLFFAIVINIFLFSGCAFTPQTIGINSLLSVRDDNVGQGKNIYISIVDKRPNNVIGHRTPISSMSARIMTADNFVSQLQKTFTDNFQKRGFDVVNDKGESLQIFVKINTIDHVLGMGMVELSVNTVVSMEVIAQNRDKKFDQNYYTELKTSQPVTPSEQFNEKMVNQAISENLMKIFDDENFFAFLTQ